jgi:large subunit ribosomal protein L6
MSRVGKKAIDVPGGVSVEVAGSKVKVSGPKAKQPLTFSVPARVAVSLEESGKRVVVTRQNDEKQSRSLHGMSRALIANMIRGVSEGFEKRLLIYGTGYNCKVEGQKLFLNCGYMGRGTKTKPQFEIPIPAGLDVIAEVPAARGDSDPAKLVIRGADRQVVGQFAASVRAIRPPEPYKGKGIRYDDEFVQRKAGKAFAGGGG